MSDHTNKKAPVGPGAVSKRRPEKNLPPEGPDFKRAAGVGLGMVREWLPDGQPEGVEWVSRNPTRADAHPGSFKVNESTGAWCDFATGDKGGDAVSLLAYLRGLSQADAARMLLGPLNAAPPVHTRPVPPPRAKADPVRPVPDSSNSIKAITRSSYAAKAWGTPKKDWSYTDATGAELFRVIRFEKEPDDQGRVSKAVLPFHYTRANRWEGGTGYHGAQPRPLFNLHELAKSTGPVLVVEGEKCASVRVHGYTLTTWQGGSRAVKKTDWSPLQGRRVVVWPDADEPGQDAARDIAAAVPGVEVMRIEGRPEGWDIADAEQEKIDLAAFVANCPRVGDSRQVINLSEVVELDRQSGAMVEALARSGAEIFVMGGAMVRIVHHEPARPQVLGIDSLRHEASRHVQFVEMRKDRKGEGFHEVELHPPLPVIRDALARGGWPFPHLEGIAPHPVLGLDGSMGNRSGYHPASRLWVDLAPALEGMMVPPVPTREEVRAAVTLLESVVVDFPFAEEGSKAGALAMLMTALCRSLVPGPCPIVLISAPAPGTGKTLLAQVLLRIATGAEPPLLGETRDSDEFAKQLTACLMFGPVALVVDNLNGKIDSGILASVATAGTYRGRILGRSEMVDLKVRALLVLTANNPQTSNEIARRCVPIRIVPNSENPYQRDGFKHPDLKAYVDESRAELVRAGLLLARSWIAAGCPAPKGKPLGSFENWFRVIGGILEHAGVAGLMSNARDFYAAADTETQAWISFVEGWHREHDTRMVKTTDLVDLALRLEVIEESRSGTAKGNATALGRQLAKLADRVYGGFRIGRGPVISNSQTWKLSPVGGGDIGDFRDFCPPSHESVSSDQRTPYTDGREKVPEVHKVPEPVTEPGGLGIF